jgi:anti-sigma B factor antagonist
VKEGSQLRLDTVTDAQQGTMVVIVRGEVDAHSVPQLRAVTMAAIADGMWSLELDVSELRFMDSTGVGLLVALLRRLEPLQGSLTLRGASPQVRRLLEITDLGARIVLLE